MKVGLVFKKALGVICAVCVIIGAVYVPMAFSVSAAVIPVEDDQTVVFGFNNGEGSVTDVTDANNLTRGNDGIGCAGWGPTITTRVDRQHRWEMLGVYHTNDVRYGDGGGYRLNNSDGVYTLEPNTSYIVSFKLQVNSTPLNTVSNPNTKTSSLDLGYGFKGNPSSNPCSEMKTVIARVFTANSVDLADKNNGVFELTTAFGTKTYSVGETWHDLTYAFTTPENLGDGIASLGFYSFSFYGTDFLIDDVSVTKVASNKGVVVALDEYSSSFKVYSGEIDTAVELPTLTSDNSEHEFLGWYKDTDRNETAEGLKFASGITTVYSAWKSPVTITFVDTLNGGEPYTVSGVAGNKIDYPTDPVDTVNEPEEYWFMGWYTSESYTEEFTDSEFGYKNITVYSRWQGLYETMVEDFENYGSHYRTERVESDGKLYYANRWYFGYAMDKITEENNNYIKFTWESDTVKLDDVAGSYDAAKRYSQSDHMIKMDNAPLLDGVTYTATFDYYVESISNTQRVTVNPLNAHPFNIWQTGASFENANLVFGAEKMDGEWHKGEFSFTMKYADAGKTGLFIMVYLSENSDAVIKFDNFKFVPVQPYESAVTYIANNGDGPKLVKGNRGEEIPEYIPQNKDVNFLGWFTDKELKVPFTDTVFGRLPITLYGKWSAYPTSFENYKYASTNRNEFGVSMSIKEGEGVGYDDNHALLWHLDGNQIRNVADNGVPVYMKDRVGFGRDSAARICTLLNNTAYKITYYYKAVEGSNYDANITFSTCHNSFIWHTNYKWYGYTSQKVSKDQTDWVKVETFLITDFVDENGNMLYIEFTGDVAPGTEGIDISVLVDNVLVEEVEKPYVVFDGQNDSYVKLVSGKSGEKIPSVEEPKKTAFDFKGWYLDKECTVPFTQTVFGADDAFFVYAKYEKSRFAFYDFENYGFAYNPGWFQLGNGLANGEWGVAKSGKNSIKIDRHDIDANNRIGHLIIGDKGEDYKLEANRKYVVTFSYLVEERGTAEAKIAFRSAMFKSAFGANLNVTQEFSVSTVAPLGVWKEKALVIDTTGIDVANGGDSLYLIVSKGQDFVMYIDDIQIEMLPENYNAYVVDNAEAANVPQYVAGPMGSSFVNLLPKAPKKDNHVFLGYIFYDESLNVDDLTPDKMVFSDKKMQIKANFVRLETVQNFDGEYEQMFVYYKDYGTIDFDYEIYDSAKQGNSKDNVTSGRKSLHRKGTSYHFENAQVLTQNQMLTAGERYTVTMKVKLGKYLQTDGAVKFASNKALNYPWSVTGEYYPIAPIADLLDGEWHTVSYTFNAVECYFIVQTPGYCELFIDDISITRVTKDTPLSTPAEYTEYVPAKRDADGKIVDMPAVVIDVDSIIDESLLNKVGKNNMFIEKIFNSDNFNALYVILGGAAVIIAIAAVAVILIVKKRKAKKS